jgi:flagellar protein FliO/FliZ
MHIDLQILKLAVLVNLLLISLNISAEEVTETQSAMTGITQPLSANYLIQFTLGLVIVLLAMLSLMWLLRRVGRFQSSAGGALKTLGGLSLGARERVVLIQVGDAHLLLGVAPGRVETLYVMDHAQQNQSTSSGKKQRNEFTQRLTNEIDKNISTGGTTK